MYKNLSLCLLLLVLANSDYLDNSLTSYSTLASAVTYTYNYTFIPTNIEATSQPIVFFSSNYNINPTDLKNCLFVLSNSAASYSSTACILSKNSTGNYLSFTDVYPSLLNSQTFLGLKVMIEII